MWTWRRVIPSLLLPTLLVGGLLAGCATAVTGTATAAGPFVPTSLSCSGGTVVAPKGAPYCYLVPAGFTNATGQLTLNYQSANPSQFDSAVAVAVHDVIIVAVYPLRENSDTVSSTVLGSQVQAVLDQGESSGFTITGSPTPTTVDGARAFVIPIKQNDGQYGSTIYFVFRGFTEVEINCQFANEPDTINTGCASVRDSIQIIDAHR